jgi:uncharacterized protein YutE (UPF0331/DUF86 family)
VDRELIESKLESLRRYVRRIEAKIPESIELLRGDYDLQDIIVLNLERAVQNSVDIAAHILSTVEDVIVPASMVDAFRSLEEGSIIDSDCALRMTKAVGFRNTAVHAYQQLDYDIVYSIVTQHLDDFREYASQILRFMNRDG